MMLLKIWAIHLLFRRKKYNLFFFPITLVLQYYEILFRPSVKSFDEPEMAQRKPTPETIDYDGMSTISELSYNFLSS